jgi:nitrogenase iron protein NifH
MTQHIAFYGKGGAGKSTLAANIAAALAEGGHRVLLVGCDPKADTGTLLHGRESVRTIIDSLAAGDDSPAETFVTKGFRDVACTELGDPADLGECAAVGIARAFARLAELQVIAASRADFVFYDIPGDTGCSGVASPIRQIACQRAFVVIGADLTSLYTANALFRDYQQHRQERPIPVALIANGLSGSFEDSFVRDFARQVGVQLFGSIPRSLVVKQCELYRQTVIEAAPLANLAHYYRRLARYLVAGDLPEHSAVPQAITTADLKQWARGWGDCISEMEFGVIRDGAGI